MSCTRTGARILTSTCRTLEDIANLKKDFRERTTIVANARKATNLANKESAKISTAEQSKKPNVQKAKRITTQQKELRDTSKALTTAKRKFEDQVSDEAKRQCLPICEAMYEKLPRELRDMVYEFLIIGTNATFYNGQGDKVQLANGCSPLNHCFNVDFIGMGMHRDLIQELGRKGARFDIRRCHGLLAKVFTQHGTDLAFTIKNVGISLRLDDIKTSEKVVSSLDALYKLQKGSTIHVFVVADGRSKKQVKRCFGHVLRAFMPFLVRLKSAGYVICIVMNPSYENSTVSNNVGSQISIIRDQEFGYLFTLAEMDVTAELKAIEKNLKEV
jgi:hypothetical protein